MLIIVSYSLLNAFSVTGIANIFSQYSTRMVYFVSGSLFNVKKTNSFLSLPTDRRTNTFNHPLDIENKKGDEGWVFRYRYQNIAALDVIKFNNISLIILNAFL